MNTLFGFGGLANAGLTAASAVKSAPRLNNKNNNNNNNNNNYVPFANTRKKVGNLTKKAASTLTGLFGKKKENAVMAPMAPVGSSSTFGLNQYKSKVPALKSRTRKNNVYVPSNTEAPNLNLSYVRNRNESVRNTFNKMVVGQSMNKPESALTNKQKAARVEVARKMARGEPVTFMEKLQAGMVSMPKPTGPRPVKPSGGKRSRKVSRRRRTVRRR